MTSPKYEPNPNKLYSVVFPKQLETVAVSNLPRVCRGDVVRINRTCIGYVYWQKLEEPSYNVTIIKILTKRAIHNRATSTVSNVPELMLQEYNQ